MKAFRKKIENKNKNSTKLKKAEDLTIEIF